jgi:hypothetical protein
MSNSFIRATALLMLSTFGGASAQALQGTINFSVIVLGVCQVQLLDDEGVTLRCTRNFSPADPRTVPALAGQLPPRPLALVDTQVAPEGGTLNRYVFAWAANAEQREQPAEMIAFY